MTTSDSVSISAGVENVSVVFIVVIKVFEEHSSIVGEEGIAQAWVGRIWSSSFEFVGCALA